MNRLITILHCEHRLYGHMHRRESIVKIHIVQKGDTLWKIAKKYGVNFEELKSLNSQLSNTDMIMPGMKIKVPTSGGSIKKEAPIMGTKKEMPIAMKPIVKEAPKKEMPVKEMPVKEMPVKEMPKKEIPKKEAPKEKPYTPKMPTPIIPEIDVTNYYSMNMTNIDVDVDVELEEKKVQPPPIPAPVLPKQEPIQQEVCPPIVPYQPYCYEVSPMMPGSGFPPGVCPPVGVPVEQVAPQAYPTLPGVEYTEKHKWEESSSSYSPYTNGGFQAPAHGNHVPQEYYQQPLVQYGQMPVEHHHHKGEESSYVAGTAYQPYAPTHTEPVQPSYNLPYKEDCGCGAPSFPQAAYPSDLAQGYGAAPQGFGPEIGGYPPAGGFNPGIGMGAIPQGFGPEIGGYPPAGGFNPGIGMGAIPPQGFGPEMGGYPPAGGFNPGIGMGAMPPQGFGPEMGGYPPAGGFNPGMGMGAMPQGFGPEMGGYPMSPTPYPQGVSGNTPMPYPVENTGLVQDAPSYEGSIAQPVSPELTPPVYGPGGNAPVFTPAYNQNMGQPPFMNPYGVNQGTPFGMPRYQEDESSDL